jgi:hypothetical protein
LSQEEPRQVRQQEREQDGDLRERIARLLAGGIETDWRTRADDSQRFHAVVGALRAGGGDLAGKLRVAGFTDHPVPHEGIDQACESCMYYLVHRRYCALPEIDLPVQPEWSCNVWRV